jgi:hypothetical protein
MKLIIVVAWIALTLSFFAMFKLMGNVPFETKIVAGIVVANVITVVGVIASGFIFK